MAEGRKVRVDMRGETALIVWVKYQALVLSAKKRASKMFGSLLVCQVGIGDKLCTLVNGKHNVGMCSGHKKVQFAYSGFVSIWRHMVQHQD